MTWNNHGKWEFDHKIPIRKNNPTRTQFTNRLHFTNIQPVWRGENRRKGNL